MALIFFRISFNAPVRHQKTQELACRHTKDALSRIKHHFINPEVIKGLHQVINQRLLLSRFHYNIIHIGMNIAADLIMKTILHAALVSRLGALESKGHRYIAEGSKGSYKSCLLLVLNCHFDLMITRVASKKLKRSQPAVASII